MGPLLTALDDTAPTKPAPPGHVAAYIRPLSFPCRSPLPPKLCFSRFPNKLWSCQTLSQVFLAGWMQVLEAASPHLNAGSIGPVQLALRCADDNWEPCGKPCLSPGNISRQQPSCGTLWADGLHGEAREKKLQGRFAFGTGLDSVLGSGVPSRPGSSGS